MCPYKCVYWIWTYCTAVEGVVRCRRVKMFKFVVAVGLICGCCAELPSYIKVCKRSDPDLTRCVINSVEQLRPKLKEGLPELGVPSLEPLPLENLQLKSGPRQAKIDANITRLKVWGPTSFQILSLKADVAKTQFLFRVNLPKIVFKGEYDLDMNVLILKFKGHGPLNGNFTDLMTDVALKGRIENIDGANHVQFDKIKIKIHIGKSYFHLDELFQRDPILGRATNEVINDNSDLFINEIRPALEESLAMKFTDIANALCKRFTYEELFPE